MIWFHSHVSIEAVTGFEPRPSELISEMCTELQACMWQATFMRGFLYGK